MLIGATMLLTTNFLYVIVGVDTTKPSIISSTPQDKSLGYLPQSFIDNRKYSIHVHDSGCGVSTVTYLDSVTQGYVPPTRTLTLISGTIYDGTWEGSFPTGATYAPNTDYSFTFVAVDGKGNGQTLTGTFRVYTALSGRWYVAGTEITDPSQTVWVSSNQVEFKFVKSAGLPDAQVTCALSGGVTGTLSLVSANTWTVTKTLSDGTYTITCTASQPNPSGGTDSVSMSIYGLGIGDEDIVPVVTEENTMYLLSFCLIGIGFALFVKGKKSAKAS